MGSFTKFETGRGNHRLVVREKPPPQIEIISFVGNKLIAMYWIHTYLGNIALDSAVKTV